MNHKKEKGEESHLKTTTGLVDTSCFAFSIAIFLINQSIKISNVENPKFSAQIFLTLPSA